MAFAMLMYKARRVTNRKKRLEIEKFHAMKLHLGKIPKYTLADKYIHAKISIKLKIQKLIKDVFSFKEGSYMSRRSLMMRTHGTLENYLFKSLVGFAGGFFLVYLFFMFFVIILNFSLGSATLMCSIFGCILTIGLAFSERVRCFVFLILPQFFSKRGRQALLAYAFVLAITGPAKNTVNNMGILSESLACGQEQLKQAIKQIIDVIKKPFLAIKEAIKKIVLVVKKIVKKIKEIFITIKRIVMGIARVIKSAFQFLGKIFNICSKKVGTPFERCIRVFDNAVTDCYAQLGPMFNWLCSLVYVTQYVCYIVKPLDFICMLLDFINNSVVGVIVRKVKKFVRHIRSTFYVRIRFSHSFSFETTASKSMKEISEGILAEIRERTSKLNDIFNIVTGITSMFFLVVVLKALHYRHKYLTVERFDNKYITKDFREIDFRRAQMEKETILPLNHRERKKYLTLTSIRLTDQEKQSLSKALAILASTSFKIVIYMVLDFCLFWILDLIRFFGKYTNTIEPPRMVGVNIAGDGFVADLFRSVAKAFNPMGLKMNVDTVPCLPDPIPPDYDKYLQITLTLFICWVMTVFEPYGLRLRSKVMIYYYPARAKERAIWLYNHILRNRTTFLKFARRKLKKQFLGLDKGDTSITWREMLRAKIDFKIIRMLLCLGTDRQEACVVCAEIFRPGEEVRPIRCSTPGCPGLYCEQCFTDIRNLCTICLDPIQYGDLSDIDEERDSSEDETSAKYKRRHKKEKQKPEYFDKSSINNDSYDDNNDETSAKYKRRHKNEIQESEYFDKSSINDDSYDNNNDETSAKYKRRHKNEIQESEYFDKSSINDDSYDDNNDETSAKYKRRPKNEIQELEYFDKSSINDDNYDDNNDESSAKYKRRYKNELQEPEYFDKSSINDDNNDESSAKYNRRHKNEIQKPEYFDKSSIDDDDSVEIRVHEYIDKSSINDDNDETRKLYQRGGQDKISSNSSETSNSTEYSYSYQYTKNYKDFKTPLRASFVDIEQQRIPDYASMTTFQDYLFQGEDRSETIRRETETSHILELSDSDDSSSTFNSEESIYFSKSSRKKVKKWLHGETLYNRTEEIIPLLDLRTSTDKYTTSTPEDVQTTTSLTEHVSTSPTNKLNHLFTSVKYSEITETPRSLSSEATNTSISSSNFRNRKQRSEKSTLLSSSKDEASLKKYKEKVRNYYKNISAKKMR